MSSKRAIRRRSCKGKVRHASREAGSAMVRRLHNSKGYQGQLDVYRCPFCGGWQASGAGAMSDATQFAGPHVMSDRLSRLLDLVRGGVSRKPVLALMSGHSLRTLKTLLHCLVEHGYVVSIKTDPQDWSWVPVETAQSIKAAAARRGAESERRRLQRDGARRKQARAVKLPRGHGDSLRQVVLPAAQGRRIKKTAPASVWELGAMSTPRPTPPETPSHR